MDVTSFSSLPAHVNDREARDGAVTRVRAKKQHKRALVRIHSITPSPYSQLTNNTVHGGTFQPKGDEHRLVECEIKVMKLTSETTGQQGVTSPADITTSIAGSSIIVRPVSCSGSSATAVKATSATISTALPSTSGRLTDIFPTTIVDHKRDDLLTEDINSTSASLTVSKSSSISCTPETATSSGASSAAESKVSSSVSAKANLTETSLESSIKQQAASSDQPTSTKASPANLTLTSSSPFAVSTDSAEIRSSTASNDASTSPDQSGTPSTIASHQQGVTSSAGKKSKRLLFLGSKLLDVIRYPDANRFQLNRKKSPVDDAEPTQKTEPHRREAGLPPATSSAARSGGILDSVVFGVLGGLFSSARGQATMTPALSSLADEHQDGGSVRPLNRSTRLDSTGNLALATLLAAKFNDRQVTLGSIKAPTFSQQDLLATSPGMRLLNNVRRIEVGLQMEVTAFLNHLDGGKPVITNWDLDDLVNIAILKVLPETTARVSETFLYEVLKSPHIGVAHERPENIFAADGSVRGRPDGDPVIFYDLVTGQTTTRGPAVGLAKAMLQALARSRLASYQDDGLPETLHHTIVRQADHLNQRQSNGSWRASIAGLVTVPDIVDTLDTRIAAGDSVLVQTQSLDPVMTVLSRGRYDQGEKLFMQLSAQQQFNRVQALAREPDYLGLDYSAAPLEQLRADMPAITKNGRKMPHWQSFQFSQQAWQLFSHLYDGKFAAPAEAINRIKMITTLSRGLIGDDEAQQLSKLFIRLLPRRTSASDYVSVSPAHPAQQAHSQTLVQLHRFDPVQIAEMISSYEELKSYAEEHFAEVFGDAISGPELRRELINLVAQTSLERLRGDLLSCSWRNVVKQALKEEFAEFFQGLNDKQKLSV